MRRCARTTHAVDQARRAWQVELGQTNAIDECIHMLISGGPSKATLIDINGDRPKLFDMPELTKTYHWSNATQNCMTLFQTSMEFDVLADGHRFLPKQVAWVPIHLLFYLTG